MYSRMRFFAAIVDAHNHQGRNCAFADQPVAGLIHLPFDSCEGSRSFEQILPIIQVEDRVMPVCIRGIVISREAARRAGIACCEKFGCEIRAGANLRSRPARGLRREQDQEQLLSVCWISSIRKKCNHQNTTADPLYAFALRTFTAIASRLIREIIASERQAQNAPGHQFVGFDISQVEREG